MDGGGGSGGGVGTRRTRYAPAWLGGFQDLEREHGFQPLRVDGRVPPELAGTIYRNGPGRFGVAGERYRHWFDGDGAVAAVRFPGDGGALGAVRIVRTLGLLREQKAGKRLFGAYDTPLARPLREFFLGDRKNPANTSVLLWQGRLFATCEAGEPHELTTSDLATLGETDLGVIDTAFSAHTHYVPSRRCAYNFGLEPGRETSVGVYALPDDGPARKISSFHVEGARLCHDFVVTDRHLVVVFAPMYLSPLAMVLLRKGPVGGAKWRPGRGAEVVVVPLDAPTAVRRFRTDAFMVEHVANAFEDGDEIVFDYTHYAEPYALEGFVRGLVRGEIEAPMRSSMRRARVDVARSRLTSSPLLERTVELPRVSPRVETRRHRFAYYAAHSGDATNQPFDAVMKHDLESGRLETYAPGADAFPGEAIFVPKRDAQAEDDGWLMTFVYDARADCGRLEILDARGVADGPIARCWFDQRLPFGFHAAWQG